jgi:hypothetical protein
MDKYKYIKRKGGIMGYYKEQDIKNMNDEKEELLKEKLNDDYKRDMKYKHDELVVEEIKELIDDNELHIDWIQDLMNYLREIHQERIK